MGDEKNSVVVCIPALNEERNIAKVIVGSKKFTGRIIVCDDGSNDMTSEIAQSLGAEVIRHERNMGKGDALRTLFLAARAYHPEAMVTIDGDAQHDPSEIPRLLEPIRKGEADIVIGSRFTKEGSPIPSYRRLGNRMLNAVTVSDIKDTQSGFRAYSLRALMDILPTERGMGVDSEILSYASQKGLRIQEVATSVSYHGGGTSKTNPMFHVLDVFLSMVKHNSIRHPLLFYGGPGGVLRILALGFWYWVGKEFVATRSLMVSAALLAIGFTLVGLMLMTTAVILWVTISVIRGEKPAEK